MASAAHITPLGQRTSSSDLKARADALTCLLDLLSDNLTAMRTGVRDHGVHALALHEWHLADVLLALAAEQAAFVADCA